MSANFRSFPTDFLSFPAKSRFLLMSFVSAQNLKRAEQMPKAPKSDHMEDLGMHICVCLRVCPCISVMRLATAGHINKTYLSPGSSNPNHIVFWFMKPWGRMTAARPHRRRCLALLRRSKPGATAPAEFRVPAPNHGSAGPAAPWCPGHFLQKGEMAVNMNLKCWILVDFNQFEVYTARKNTSPGGVGGWR